MEKQTVNIDVNSGDYKFGFKDDHKSLFQTKRGLGRSVIDEISDQKDEPQWMRDFRLKSLEIFLKKPMPKWGPNLQEIDLNDFIYYIKPTDKQEQNWDDVPEDIKNTFDKLGIPEAEKKWLGGVGAQYDSEMVYHNIREDLAKKGVIFVNPETAIKEHPELVKKYFGKVIPAGDNKFSALNSAFWSGGSFVYVPPGVKVDIPLQAYFRINTERMGQFERTLIIADEGSSVHYVEGCTAPTYSTSSLHSAVVEIIALKGSKVRYSTIQNWSNNVYNLVTKRALAYENAQVEWVDGNLGSKITMKYPAVYLMGEGAHGEVLSIALAGDGQLQDTGAKMVHVASNTTSVVTSKSISKNGGTSSYRGLVKVAKGAKNIKSKVVCDALILDETSRSDTYPTIENAEEQVQVEHEATVSKISEDQLYYLMSRGISEEDASKMIVNGFIDPFVKELPMEYAVELNRLIDLEMEGSVG